LIILNRTNIRNIIQVRYRLYSIDKSYKLFQEKYGADFCKEGAFFNHKPRWIKKSKSKVDCCPMCKKEQQFEKYLAKKKLQKVGLSVEDVSIQEEYTLHKQMIDQRSKDFETQVSSLVEGSCVLIMDFKANINLGNGPEMDSTIFFQAPQRTVFGVVGYFKKDGITYKIIFNVISPVLNHDSTMVHDILERVLTHNIFSQFNIHSISFWMDNAPNQFRTKEFYATMLDVEPMMKKNRPNLRNLQVEFNFFVEYHGKSDCDRFFGMLARLYAERTSGANAIDVQTTSEFIRVFSDGIHEQGGYVIDDQVDFSKLLSVEDEKVNVHTFELIPRYISEENIASTIRERKTVIKTRVVVKKVSTHDVITMVYEPNQIQFPGKKYPYRLSGEFVWGNFYSFRIAFIDEINRFAKEEEAEKSFALDPRNIKHLHPETPKRKKGFIGPLPKPIKRQVRHKKTKTKTNSSCVEYGSNVLLASTHGGMIDNFTVRVPVCVEAITVSRDVKIAGNVKEKGFRFKKLQTKSAFYTNHPR
jgi:hypothetical protein